MSEGQNLPETVDVSKHIPEAVRTGAPIVVQHRQENSFSQLQAAKADALDFFARFPDQMTLDALCEASLPVYIQNHLAKAGRCAIDFEISGKRTTVTVPNSWLPVCLNDRMNPNDIRSSGSLRDHLTKGSVILLHPSEALKLLNSPRGQREMEKRRSKHVKASNTPTPIREDVSEAEQKVSGRMQMLVIELENAGLDAGKRQDVLDKIYDQVRVFSRADIEYFQLKTQGDTLAQAQADEMFTELDKREAATNASFGIGA